MSESELNPEFEALLDYIKHSRGFDLLAYKRNGLMRRVDKRLQAIGIERYVDYLDYLEVHPQEFTNLFNALLINVTSFFRDRTFWEYLLSEIIPRIAASKEPHQSIRVWSAGCASGEEAYSLAMAMAETLGVQQCRERVKIYATDVDQEALDYARQGSYPEKKAEEIPPELLDKYFERVGECYVFHKDLRRSVIFGCHDLVQDAPISRIDLLTCRNTLMYFNSEAQAKILNRFHFALNDGGFLGLGRAEMLQTSLNTFTTVDLKRRVFLKVPKENLRDRLLLIAQPGNEEAINNLTSHMQIREAAYDVSPVAQVVVDLNGLLILANERVRAMFSLTPTDLGRRLRDLELSYRPVELRSCIEQVYTNRQIVTLRDIKWTTTAGVRDLEVQLTPLQNSSGSLIGVSITFADVSHYKDLQEEVERSNQELEMAYEELQSTNEELETTNEELQSTIEELETNTSCLRLKSGKLSVTLPLKSCWSQCSSKNFPSSVQ